MLGRCSSLTTCAGGFTSLDCNEGRFVDDGKVRDLSSDPLSFRIRPADPLARIGVLDESLSVPDVHSSIELILENAVLSLSAAIDRGCVPDAASWTRHALAI